MRPDGANPRRRPYRDALPRLPGYCAMGDGDLRGRQTRDGVPLRRPPGLRNLRASHWVPAQRLRCAPDRARCADIMSQLRTASLFLAVVAGDYAALRLIYGQLTDFGVSAAVCAGSLVAAGLIAHAENRRREVARGRAAVWQRRGN